MYHHSSVQSCCASLTIWRRRNSKCPILYNRTTTMGRVEGLRALFGQRTVVFNGSTMHPRLKLHLSITTDSRQFALD